MGLLVESGRKLQWVQNAAARLLTGAAYRDYITPPPPPLVTAAPLAADLFPGTSKGWFEVTYKALNDLVPSSLKGCLSLSVHLPFLKVVFVCSFFIFVHILFLSLNAIF